MEDLNTFRAGDEWESQWEANKIAAQDECMMEVDNILMEVEHIVHDLDQRLHVQNTRVLAKAIDQLEELINYRYVDPYNDEPYDYVFTKQVKRALQDGLSFELGEN